MNYEVRDHTTKERGLDLSLCDRVLAELALSANFRHSNTAITVSY